MILDGWGIGKHDKGDVIFKTPTPYLDYLTAVSAHSTLQTCGEDVGLPNGQMGNSEVGHLNIGAGRVVYQDLVKINKACESGDILKNQEIINAYSYAQKTGKKLHLMGLTSTGGVHSSLDHLFKLIEIGKEYGLKETYVHCFMDGRDTDPKSGKGFIEEVQACCDKNGAHIASIVGRFYAMDRDKRWNRVKEAYDLLVEGKGKQADDMVKAMYVAAGIGKVIAENAFIAGAAGGCQAEIGSASAMAAGALAFLQGGDSSAIINAATLSLKNFLGLVCDPVAGLVEVPCIKRNSYGAVNAVTSAQLSLAGIKSAIAPDDVVDSMRRIGNQLPASLKETSCGGLAITESAQNYLNQSF